ncbi:FAD dependent oxidoreductase superfamily [Talaromyces proteolyticus]|uniref:FAD dependent oxidoreductase superfamily n=1 Tax=Talaromyces proteolyticus TaxID=1131652 RepID=A0AAD4KN17_9EURO|nr:FAD dependent oxidoreductase superfamily [Talaromyces proteolyticus]KAH8696432.1 FAD dependent oxidoreductase superfamily [Talaromyces proteolyticus]
MPKAIPPETIVVIGAGVIGLSAALLLQSTLLPSQRIVIIARNLPHTESINYASPWAGGHYRPVPGTTAQLKQESQWARHTYQTFERIAAEDISAGVQFMRGIEHFESPSPEYVDVALDVNSSVYAHLSPSFRRISQKELADEQVKLGITYWTYCVNTPVYLGWLLRKFLLGGGVVKEYTLASIDEAFALGASDGGGVVKAVVNCSGMGFNDEKSFIIRGQTCLVRNPISYTLTRQGADGTWSFAIPRPLMGGTVIGGTKQPGDWNPHARAEIRETLLRNASKWFPFEGGEGGEFDVIRDIVGRRPAREGGLRVEIERVDVVAPDTMHGQKKEGKSVVHAYGLGGRGVELSWGVAEEVKALMLREGLIAERAAL